MVVNSDYFINIDLKENSCPIRVNHTNELSLIKYIYYTYIKQLIQNLFSTF